MKTKHVRLGQRVAVPKCGGKNYYASKREAQTVINYQLTAKAARSRHGRPDFLRAYECGRCGGWHLTKQEPA